MVSSCNWTSRIQSHTSLAVALASSSSLRIPVSDSHTIPVITAEPSGRCVGEMAPASIINSIIFLPVQLLCMCKRRWPSASGPEACTNHLSSLAPMFGVLDVAMKPCVRMMAPTSTQPASANPALFTPGRKPSSKVGSWCGSIATDHVDIIGFTNGSSFHSEGRTR
jgi:hypothetical protein